MSVTKIQELNGLGPVRATRARAAEWGGGLAVRIAAKLPVPDLSDLEAIEAEVPVLERLRALQAELAEEFARLTGRDIRRVSFTVTGAIIPKRKRVR